MKMENGKFFKVKVEYLLLLPVKTDKE